MIDVNKIRLDEWNPQQVTTPSTTTGGTTPTGGTMGYMPPLPATPQTNIPWPEQWGTATKTLTGMAETGMPTTYAPWYQQARQVATQDISDAIRQAAEQAGLGGMRWSTPLGRTAQDIAGRTMGRVGTEWLGKEIGALEQARQRQLAATGQLAPLGQAVGQYPMDIAQRAMQMGQAMTGQRQAAISPLYQEFMRQIPEASPWLQLALGATQMPFTQAPQMYQPSLYSQMLGAGAAVAPFALMASSEQFKKDINKISEVEEDKIFEQIKNAPLFNYRYKFEPDDSVKHLGLITEYSPKEVTLFDDKVVGLYEYVSALHATIKALSRKIEKLET